MANGWIKVERSVADNWTWKERPFSYGQAWIDLIILANWEDKKTSYKGEIITCKRGDVNLSLSYLAERWGWSRWKVTNFMKLLEADNMVTLNCTTHRTTVTVEKYGFYQVSPTTKWATNQQQTDITKNNKNIKNIYVPNKFNQFEHTDYDFDAIERAIQ